MAQVTVEAQYIADTAQYVKALRTAAAATQALADQIPNQVQQQDNLKKSTEALGQGAQEASKGFTILRNAMGTALGVAAVNLVTNLTGRFKAFAKQSFDAAARVEELDIAMTSIGKATGLGADAIKDATEAIRKNGIELAASQQIAIEFAQNQLDLASASKVARVAQDLAVIAGQNSTATTQLLTQAIITGNSMLLKSAGISRLASEGYAEYAKQIGKSVRQLSAQERQQAVTNLILKEGERVAGTYEGAMNAAGKVLRSFKRIINDIQIEMGKILLNAFGPLIKSTYDLLKAFSKTMREGGALSGTLTMLSENFQLLTEPLVQFIKNLTESVKSGEAMKNIGTTVEEIIPTLMTAVETVRALAATYASVLIPAIQALTPLLSAVASLLQPVLRLFTSLPEPIRMVIGLFVLLQIAMARSAAAAKIFGVTWVQLQTKFVMAFVGMANAITAFEVRWKAARASSIAGMGTFAAAAKLMAAGFVASVRAMTAAVRGFFSALGPVGIALVGLTVAFEIFSSRSAQTQARVERLRDTVDETTGAFTELTKATIMQDLRDMFSPEDQAVLREMGFGVEAMAEAMMQGGPAVDNMISRMNEFVDQESVLGFSMSRAGDLVQDARKNYREYAGDLETTTAVVEQARKDADASALRSAAVDYKAAMDSIAAAKAQSIEKQNALNEMTEAERNHANFVANSSEQMARATASAKAAIEGLTAATNAMNEAISAEATYDKARKSIKNLGKSFKDNGKKVKGFSDAALNNREAIRNAASSYIEYANSLDDPIERQAALEEGQQRITAAMEKAGIDPSKSKILQTMKEEAEQSGKTVDEFAKQRLLASQYGNDVGKNFIDGIIEELARGKSQVDTAGGDAVAGLPDAANAQLGSRSPSREAMKVAKNFVDGIIEGVKKNKRLAEMEVSDLGQGMLDALEDKLNEFSGKMQTAISAFSNISGLIGGTRAEFGLPSQIMETFGEDASISGVLSSYEDLSSSVQEMFAPFLDKEMVPKKVRRENRKAMNSALGELKQLTKNTVKLLQDRERIQQDMRDLDQAYSQQTASINKHYDKLEKAAADNTKRIEQHYAQLIPRLDNAYKAANAAFERENRVLEGLISDRNKFLEGISTGFRSFLNNLKVDVSKSSKTVTRMTKKMVNGLEVLTQETFTEESTTGGSFADALQGRLKALREFTANIRTLLSRGLDPALVQDLVAAGVENAGDTVSALAAGSSQEIAEINAAQNELGGLIESFQKTSSEQWFDYGIAQQQAIVTPLQIAAEQARVALEQAQIARDMELAAARAHQEQLRIDRQAELDQAREDYTTQKDELIKQSADINDELNLNAQNIEDVFLALRDSMKKKMIPTGRRIINGIIRGLRDREGALYAKARAIADNVKRTIEAAFQIASPSKVTRTMGQQIADGLALGMEDGFRSVSKAAAALADSAMVPLTTPDFSGLGAAPSVGAMSGGAVRSGPITSNYNVTVNAGMGADKTEIARVVVDSLKQYERRNGPIPITVRS